MKALLVDVSPFTESVTPVSLGHVGAALAAQGHAVEIISLGAQTAISPAGFRRHLEEKRPRLIGFGAYQRNLLHVLGFARLAKQILPGSCVVLGGPQATFMPDHALEVLPQVDFLSRGEGEAVISAIADALQRDDDDSPVAGATRRTASGEIVTGPLPRLSRDLDCYPSPWLTGMLDPSTTSESIMLTSRGCPHQCVFCYTPAAFNGKIRYHSVERVVEEIAWIASRGARRLWFADPNFSFSESRVTAILEGVLDRNLGIEMWIETRADMLNRALIGMMKRAGVKVVAMGLESAVPAVFSRLNKRLVPDEIRAAVALLFDAGLDVELFSQYALPHERLEDAMATLRFVQECGVRIRGNSNAQQMQLYFGSEVCSATEKFGVVPLRKTCPPYLSIGTEFETKWMSRKEIETVRGAWKAASLDEGKRMVS